MSQTQTPRRNRCSPAVESLEERKLLAAAPTAPRITQFVLDNRGQAEFSFNQAIDTKTITTDTVQMFTAGPNNTFGNGDDVKLTRSVSYKNGHLIVKTPKKSPLAADTKYRVRLAGLKGTNGLALDGEFNGLGNGLGRWTGNGSPGGNFDVSTTVATNPRARWTTSLGFINVGFFKKGVPNTIENFEHYADEATWDGTFFHRSVTKEKGGFGVIQGGGFHVVDGDSIAPVHAHAGIANESSHDNDKGTIAMANTAPTNSSNTNQWFFNVTDNNTALDHNYSVFGMVLDDASQKTMEAINKLTIVDADGGQAPADNPFGELPVRDKAAGASRAINIPGDLVMITRVALLMDVTATPGATQGAIPSQLRAMPDRIPQVAAPSDLGPRSGSFSMTKIARDRVFDDPA
jgi:cyclophilin family peptidyl-prolyl cis-trans isomerase